MGGIKNDSTPLMFYRLKQRGQTEMVRTCPEEGQRLIQIYAAVILDTLKKKVDFF